MFASTATICARAPAAAMSGGSGAQAPAMA
jgi:hypothetical protein